MDSDVAGSGNPGPPEGDDLPPGHGTENPGAGGDDPGEGSSNPGPSDEAPGRGSGNPGGGEVPEPGSVALIGLGAMALGALRRWSMKK